MNPDCLLNRIAWGKTMQEAIVRKKFYKMATGEWTEDETKADWQRWHNLPRGVMCCDMRYETYYIIAGKRYDDIHKAKDAMYDELFIKPLVIPFINQVIKHLRTAAKCVTSSLHHNEAIT